MAKLTRNYIHVTIHHKDGTKTTNPLMLGEVVIISQILKDADTDYITAQIVEVNRGYFKTLFGR